MSAPVINLISFKERDLCKYYSDAFIMKAQVKEVSDDKTTIVIGILSLLENKTGSKLVEEAFKDMIRHNLTLTVSVSETKVFTLIDSGSS